MKYKFLEHTADIKFQAYGKNLKEAFENSAYALKEVMFGKLKVKPAISKKFKVEAKDLQGLLYRFLERFLYLLDAESFIFSKIKVKKLSIDDAILYAECWGDLASSHKFTNDVKAITYNQMEVKKDKSRWICQVVLDV